jgi:hypothetical protein
MVALIAASVLEVDGRVILGAILAVVATSVALRLLGARRGWGKALLAGALGGGAGVVVAFGQADGGDLRRREDHLRHGVLLGGRAPRAPRQWCVGEFASGTGDDRRGRGSRLVLAHVRQQRMAGDVADGVQPVAIDSVNQSVMTCGQPGAGCESDTVEPDVRRVRCPFKRHDQFLRGQLPRRAGAVHAGRDHTARRNRLSPMRSTSTAAVMVRTSMPRS